MEPLQQQPPQPKSPGPSWPKALSALVVIVMLVVGYGVLAKNNHWWPHEMRSQGEVPQSNGDTLTGEITCIPHKPDGSRLTTLECAMGIKITTGRYVGKYFFVNELSKWGTAEGGLGSTIVMSGVRMVLESPRPAPGGQVYDAEGSITFESAVEIEEKYENFQYGFDFKYPSTSEDTCITDSMDYVVKILCSIGVNYDKNFPAQGGYTISLVIGDKPDVNQYGNGEPVTIGNRSAYKFIDSGRGGSQHIFWIPLKQKGLIYRGVSCTEDARECDPNGLKFENMFLATFQFMN